MCQDQYVLLGLGSDNKKKKYWFPTNSNLLYAVITVEKLNSYVLFDPLNTKNTVNNRKLSEISEILEVPEKEKNVSVTNINV